MGDCVLFWRSEEHQKGEIGYVFNPAYHGRGLATEAVVALLRLGFEGLGLHRITGHLDARNTASARVLERAGMRREAHLVENEFVKGEWTDEFDLRDAAQRVGGPAGPRLSSPARAGAAGGAARCGARGSRSSRSARSCSKSSARAGGGAIRPIRRPSSATSARTPGSVRTLRPNASAAGLMSYRCSIRRACATAARSSSANRRWPRGRPEGARPGPGWSRAPAAAGRACRGTGASGATCRAAARPP